MNKNFAMIVLQTVSHTRAEACPPPCVNTTNKLQPFGHRRGKKLRRARRARGGVLDAHLGDGRPGHVDKSVYPDFAGDRGHGHANRAVSLVPTIIKPFDVLAEGLIVKKDRGDKTAIELFIAGIRGARSSMVIALEYLGVVIEWSRGEEAETRLKETCGIEQHRPRRSAAA
jgi:hypothetical protein